MNGGDGRKLDRRDSRMSKKQKLIRSAEEELESKLGFDLYSEPEKRLGWLLTFASSSFEDEQTRKTYSCVDLYFVTQDGSTFKTKYKFRPYLFAATKGKMEMDVEAYLKRRYENQIADIEIVGKEDLDLKNHLSGLHKSYLKISFDTVQQLMDVKRDLMHVVERNQAKFDAEEAYEFVFSGKRQQRPQDSLEYIVDLREYDVPYHVRFAIDNDVRSGLWYDVSVSSNGVILEKRADLLQRAEVHVCAFDIETTKLPLKFPDADYDMVMMISYMVDGQGFLIINRECVAEDIEDLEYTPKPEFEGYFRVTNVNNERDLLTHWFAHMQEVKPGIYVTYNGDYFDWPFLEKRAAHHGLIMGDEVGFRCDMIQGECRAKFACHLDCFAWVKRDSYLPQGSQGLKFNNTFFDSLSRKKFSHTPFTFLLFDEANVFISIFGVEKGKAVTKAKLGYDPVEVNPEDMVRFAKEKPQMMASYSVSDAVATYFLYMTYVHPFIFSLATIIPMSPDEVLRKGSGTLCEMLLMVEAYKANVICPNKHQSDPEKFYNKHLLESETYIGGHVECLESGVFRSDLPTSFKLDPSAFMQLINNLDRDLQYAIQVEGKMDLESVSNYDEVRDAIHKKLVKLRDEPIRDECPLIYHLDVAAMYPNIILTNRLQPPSIVTDEVCTACDFNRPDKTCLRKLEWVWRGETYTAKRSDYYHLKKQIESELVDGTDGRLSKSFLDLPKPDQQLKLKERLKKYCQKAYKRVLDKPVTELREAGICMRENPFYVDTVRRGARWYSMEMAGVVTYTGAKIIQNARLLVEKIGRPIELDTDGGNCLLKHLCRDLKKKLTISYPCVMLNVDVARNNTNDQYQTLVDPTHKTYATHSECSIEFEVDGPYKAMILPASKEEGILIKKRYAVFNDDGTLAELKGFEIKRRGELKLIKVFQAELFDKFLHGSTLEECYSAVAAVANRWLDLLDSEGNDIADTELLDYISESSTMSKSLADYGEQKSCAVTTARRLADFLGDTMVKDKGLRCQYIVGCEPRGTPVSERAIPVAIFDTDAEIMKFYLRKWCKTSSDVGIRSIIDWSYYKQRLSSAIQKIITIPAAMQKVSNPVPRVVHPDWLHKKVREKEDKFRQRKLVDMFNTMQQVNLLKKTNETTASHMIDEEVVGDLEDMLNKTSHVDGPRPIVRCFEVNKKSVRKNGCSDSVPQDGKGEGDPLPSSPAHENNISTENIDRNLDYRGWLESKKRKWKDMVEKRKRQRLSSTQTSHRAANGVSEGHRKSSKNAPERTGVGSYFKRQEVALTQCHWQIIQLVPGSENGKLFAWVVVDGVMLKVPLSVPRVFYLNSKASVDENFPGKPVNKNLPHGRHAYNLIEVIIDEEQFKKESKKLESLLADPEIEGIYGTKVPLEFNAVLQIGCVCKVDKSAKKRNAQDGWTLSELNMKTTTECPYLEQPISFFYLYHSFSEGRAVYVGYFPASRSLSVVIVNPYSNKDLTPSILEKQFRDAFQALSIEPPPRNDVLFKVNYVGNFKDAEKNLQDAINEFRHKHHGPAIAVMECPNGHLMKSRVPLLNEFPCVNIPSNANDSNYQAVGWQQQASKIGMQRSAVSLQWLNERISLSRYAHVPLGNIELDWLIFTADVFFSRALRDQHQALDKNDCDVIIVLWISDDGIPDLGGNNEEETCFADEVHQPILTYPGAYRKVSVELKIHHLAVDALLKCNQVNELEGGALLGFDQDVNFNDQSSFDDATTSASALRVLKQLIQRCLADAVTSGNVFADAFLQHTYRWLCSPQSKLHDPALHRILHKVMQKVFALLLAELRKLGATIIFANFSKIVIDTGKFDLTAAKGYSDSLLKALQSRELFEWIELEPMHFWHSLLFMDQFNYGGIPASANDSPNDPSPVHIVSSWNIAEYLPKDVQKIFDGTVLEFMLKPLEYAKEQATIRTSYIDGNSCTPSITVAAAEGFESLMVDYLKGLIRSDFTDKLLNHVRHINLHLKEIRQAENDNMPKGDIALQFIKHICAVLALDQNVQHHVLVMRKNLLRYVHVQEFAPEAEFHDPCPSFVLPNVICSYCNDCRDLDLCRDPALLGKEWQCAVPQCSQPYDREVMENSLLQIVRQRERLYYLQDLVCLRCNQVKATHLTEQCACAGSFRCKEDVTEFHRKMRIFLKIAVQQDFQLLQECTSWILEIQS
ncbi:hypothetical protein ACFE04_018767 [Oxalis oulophora]